MKKTTKDYGYKVNINHPDIAPLYVRYKKWKKIPLWCPLSDKERLEFEQYIINSQKKEKEGIKNEKST